QTIVAHSDVAGGQTGAAAAIEVIETVGRKALIEMRRLLGGLRRAADARAGSGEEGPPIEGLPSPPPPRDHDGPTSPPAPWAARLRGWAAELAARPLIADVGLVLVMGVLMVGAFAMPWETHGPVPAALSALIVASLLFRRRVPLTVLIVIASTIFLWML